METSGGRRSGGDTPEVSAKNLWRVMQTVYLVAVKKHQPKLAALGVHLHHLLASKRDRRGVAAAREHRALTYLSSLSCRSMDPAAAVVHPYPCGAGAGACAYGHRRPSSASLPSLSCRSLDPAAAVIQYQYRPREVEFSFKSTPPRRRRRAQRCALRLQHGLPDQGRDRSSDQERYGSAATVTRLFQLMDVKEEDEAPCAVDDSGNLGQPESAVAWPPALTTGPGPAARQVRITDSPFQGREEDGEDARGAVDRRADEFITWFHEQLRTQQHRNTHYRVA